jgi:hypothetical protein
MSASTTCGECTSPVRSKCIYSTCQQHAPPAVCCHHTGMLCLHGLCLHCPMSMCCVCRYIHVAVMIYIGFGFLMTFLR